MTDQIPPVRTVPTLPNPVIVAFEDPETENPVFLFENAFKKTIGIMPWWSKLLATSPSLSNLVAFVLLMIFAPNSYMVAWIAVLHIFFIAVIIPVWFFAHVPLSGLNMIKGYSIRAFKLMYPDSKVKKSQAEKIGTGIVNAFFAGLTSFGVQMAVATIFCVVMYGAHAMDYFMTVRGGVHMPDEVPAAIYAPIAQSTVINNPPLVVVPPTKRHSLHGLPSQKLRKHCPSHIPSKG
jgi:hypothetical protein